MLPSQLFLYSVLDPVVMFVLMLVMLFLIALYLRILFCVKLPLMQNFDRTKDFRIYFYGVVCAHLHSGCMELMLNSTKGRGSGHHLLELRLPAIR